MAVSRARAAVAAVGAAAVLAAAFAPGTDTPAPEPATERLVLVSGKDDHGLVAEPLVTLTRRIGAGPVTGSVPDGTLAEVTGTRGEWLHVTTAEGPTRTGWVNDYYLRGTVHIGGPPPHCRSRAAGRLLPAGEQAMVLDLRGSSARVRTVREPHTEGWVPRKHLAELPPLGHHCATERDAGHSHGGPAT